MNTRMRAISFTFAVALLAILIGWATHASWRELRQLNLSLAAIQSNDFHRSEQVDAAQRAALGQFVKDSRQGLRFLQRLLFVSLFLLVALGGVMVLRVYRQTVAPLRAQLVDSHASVDREEKLAALGTLAAGVAHEIRNPLTAINVRVHSLKRTLIPGSSEHEDATVIDQEIQRLDRIVRDFLHFARPPDAQLATVSADRLFAKVQSLLDPQLAGTSVTLTIEASAPVWIRVDPQQMQQVLINLVQNAAESIEGKGTVTLRARTSEARLGGRSRPMVTLEVTDTGKGMPLAVRKRLFDPFFTTKETGTGLGLPIAARIVEKHGGTLQYRTEIGRGTTFGIVLPRVEGGEHECQA